MSNKLNFALDVDVNNKIIMLNMPISTSSSDFQSNVSEEVVILAIDYKGNIPINSDIYGHRD